MKIVEIGTYDQNINERCVASIRDFDRAEKIGRLLNEDVLELSALWPSHFYVIVPDCYVLRIHKQ